MIQEFRCYNKSALETTADLLEEKLQETTSLFTGLWCQLEKRNSSH